MSDVLRAKLAAVRRRRLAVESTDGLLLLLIVLPVALAMVVLMDAMLDLPWGVRAGLATPAVVAIGWVIWTRGVRPLRDPPDEDELALAVQRATPSLGSRLIAAVQLSRLPQPAGGMSPAGMSPSLIAALVHETETLAGAIDFPAVVPWRSLRRRGLLAGAIGAVSLLWFLLAGAAGHAMLLRALLVPGVPFPHRTSIDVLTPDPLVVAARKPVELIAPAGGVLPTGGTKTIDSTPQPMPRQDQNGFVAHLPAVTESFRYRIELNDAETPSRTVRVVPRPAVSAMQIVEHFPTYPRRADVVLPPDGLDVFAGSRLSMTIDSTEPATNASRLQFRTPHGIVDSSLTPDASGRKLSTSAVTPPADATGLAVRLVDRDGIDNGEAVVYPLAIIPDRPPTLAVTFPTDREQLSVPTARLVVGVDASDDVGLASIRLRYRVQHGDSGEAPVNQFDLPMEGTPMQYQRQVSFDLPSFRPRPVEGYQIEWWLVASDTNDVTGPGITESSHFTARIASAAEVRAALQQRMAEQMTTLRQADEAEQRQNDELGRWMHQ